MGSRKLTEEELAIAKQLYMEYVPVNKIAEEIGVPRLNIQYYVSTYWRQEREVLKADLMQHISEAKSVEFMSIVNGSTEILSKGIQHLLRKQKSDPDTLKAKDLKIIAEVVTSLDKIARLDANSPTEITASEVPIDVSDLRKKLAMDPFAKEDKNEDDSKNH